MQKETKKGYGVVEKVVLQDKRLNKISKLIYAYLKCFVNKDNVCFPPKSMVCDDLDISKNTFEKYIKELVSVGYITILQNRIDGKFANNVYCFNDTVTVPQFTEPHSVALDKAALDSIALDELTTNNTIFNNTIFNNTINKNTTTTLYTNNNIYSGGGSGLINYYKENINCEIKPYEVEELQSWIEKGFEENVIKECIKVAVKNKKLFLNYIIGILKRLERQNIKTYEKYIESEKTYEENKGDIKNENEEQEISEQCYGHYI